MKRKELTQEEVEIHKAAIINTIKRDFINANISYQDASLIKHVAGYRRETSNTLSDVRKILKEEVNGSIVQVGKGKVAIVKRP